MRAIAPLSIVPNARSLLRIFTSMKTLSLRSFVCFTRAIPGFTFRPWKRTQRASLDLHNLTGVVALPFHFFFAFTGLVIFASFYFLPVTSTLSDVAAVSTTSTNCPGQSRRSSFLNSPLSCTVPVVSST